MTYIYLSTDFLPKRDIKKKKKKKSTHNPSTQVRQEKLATIKNLGIAALFPRQAAL